MWPWRDFGDPNSLPQTLHFDVSCIETLPSWFKPENFQDFLGCSLRPWHSEPMLLLSNLTYSLIDFLAPWIFMWPPNIFPVKKLFLHNLHTCTFSWFFFICANKRNLRSETRQNLNFLKKNGERYFFDNQGNKHTRKLKNNRGVNETQMKKNLNLEPSFVKSWFYKG